MITATKSSLRVSSLRRLSQPVLCFVVLGLVPFLRIYLQQDIFEEWRPNEDLRRSEEPSTGMQRLTSSLRRSEELGLKDTTNRPLITRHLLKNLGLPSLNVSRLVLKGQIGPAEEEPLRFSAKDLEDLSEVLPQGKFDHRHKQCAVVGTSKRLTQEGPAHGAAIDAMDAVMRFNEAPTKGYEAHVGRRTTYRAMSLAYVKVLISAKAGRDGRRVSTGGKTVLVYGEPLVAPYVELVRRYPENLSYLLGPKFRAASRKLYKQLRERAAFLTTSRSPKNALKSTYPAFLEALFFMLQVCQTVHVYGLDADREAYYYDRKEVLALSVDVVPDQVLLIILRAMNIEGYIKIH